MPGSARVTRGEVDGYDAVTLAGPGGGLEATFLPHLGMVGCSLRHRAEELLAPRGGAAAYAERGSTFGIPLLHPWANRLSAWEYECQGHAVSLDPDSPVTHRDGDTGLPIHGLLAASPFWTVADTAADPAAARLTANLDFGAHPELLAAFPFPHRLEMTATVNDSELAISVVVTATSTEPVPIAFGFHPYIGLPGSDRRTWEIELPVRRRAQLSEQGIPTGEHEAIEPGSLDGPLGERTFDDSFDELDERPVFRVSDARRKVSVEFRSGYRVAQVYAPAASGFICFEPMTSPVDALRSGCGLASTGPDGNFRADFALVVSNV